MINGKSEWKQKDKLEKAYVEEYYKAKNMSLPTNIAGIDYHNLFESLPKDYDILAVIYRDAVQAEKIGNAKWDMAVKEAKIEFRKQTKGKKGLFEQLEEKERYALIQIELQKIESMPDLYLDMVTVVKEEATKIATGTVERIRNLEKEGKIRKDIANSPTPFDLLFYITEDKYKQDEYLIPEMVNEWYKSYIVKDRFPKDGVIDKNGKLKPECEDLEIDVYCFQNGDI